MQSSWYPENVTAETVRADLLRAHDAIERLSASSPAFREFMETVTVHYVLIYDYGKGAIDLCREESGGLRWAAGFVPPSWSR
jgi:hypothetical protein